MATFSVVTPATGAEEPVTRLAFRSRELPPPVTTPFIVTVVAFSVVAAVKLTGPS